MAIQDYLNPMQVKGKLLMQGVDRPVLDDFINKYDQAVHDIIYPEL
ncbi:MAG: hypothetical protein WC850_01720 [Candidatus Gracilibacteria bacterium]